MAFLQGADASSLQSIEIAHAGPAVAPLQPLLSSFHAIFTTLQQIAPSIANEDERRMYILRQSKCYRAELEDFLSSCAARSATDSGSLAPHGLSLEVLRVIETAKSLWHLFEVVHLDSHANITAQLLDWLHRSSEPPALLSLFLDPSPSAAAAAAATVHTPAYWTCVSRLVACGRAVDAVRLLAANDVLDAQAPGAREALVTLILSCPVYAGNAAVSELADALGVDASAFAGDAVSATDGDVEDGAAGSAAAAAASLQERFSLWQRQVHATAAAADIAARPELSPLLSVLSGSPEALAAATETWEEQLCASLALRQPWSERATVAWLADRCRKAKPPSAAAGAAGAAVYDAAVLTLLSSDALTSLRAVAAAVRLPWAAAHLADLTAHAACASLPAYYALAADAAAAAAASASAAGAGAPGASGQVTRVSLSHACDPSGPMDLRERWVSAHAATLLGTPLWRLAPGYWEHCPSTGRACVGVLVRRTRPATAADAEELLSLCARYGLPDEARAVCASVAASHAAAGRAAAAAHWFARGGLHARAAGLVAVATAEAVDAAAGLALALGVAVAAPAGVTGAAGAARKGVWGLAAWTGTAAAAHSQQAEKAWAVFQTARIRSAAVVAAVAPLAAAGAAAAGAGAAGAEAAAAGLGGGATEAWGWVSAAAAVEKVWQRLEALATVYSKSAAPTAGAGASSSGASAAKAAAAAAAAVAALVLLPEPSTDADASAAAVSAAAAVVVTPAVQAWGLGLLAALVVACASADASGAVAAPAVGSGSVAAAAAMVVRAGAGGCGAGVATGLGAGETTALMRVAHQLLAAGAIGQGGAITAAVANATGATAAGAMSDEAEGAWEAEAERCTASARAWFGLDGVNEILAAHLASALQWQQGVSV